jgi:hypothetical protein
MTTPRAKKSDRPADCPRCGSAAWWNGTRSVAIVVRTADGVARQERLRRRACCSSKQCDAPGWTVYGADDYPHRQFQLAVLVSAVVAVSLEGSTRTDAAKRHACSRDSVRRWCGWVAGLADPRHLARACARLDPDGVVHADPSTTRGSVAGQVLVLLDRLADVFAVVGLELPASGPGLARLLSDQLRRFGDVIHLTRPSPPLRVGLAVEACH